jgi:hypothetical protein
MMEWDRGGGLSLLDTKGGVGTHLISQGRASNERRCCICLVKVREGESNPYKETCSY